MRALSVALGLFVTALGQLESLSLAEDVKWLTSFERVAWSAVQPPSVCALDAFHFGVNSLPLRAFDTKIKTLLGGN